MYDAVEELKTPQETSDSGKSGSGKYALKHFEMMSVSLKIVLMPLLIYFS